MSLGNRRKNFLKINTKCVAKPKTQKAHKSLGLPDQSGRCIITALEENPVVKHVTKSNLKAFKKFYSNLAGTVLTKLPKLSNKYKINFVTD